jgi:hypothetical protein
MRTDVTRVATALALIGILAGCASLIRQDPNVTAQTMEPMLEAAGFQRLAADTPEKLAHLKTLPPLKLTKHTSNGKVQYWYADPYYCQCLLVGDWQAYQAVQRDLAQQDAVRSEQDEAMMDDEVSPGADLDPMMDPFGPFAF